VKLADAREVANLVAEHRRLARLQSEFMVSVCVGTVNLTEHNLDENIYSSRELDELARPLVRSHIAKRLNAIEAQLRQLGVSV